MTRQDDEKNEANPFEVIYTCKICGEKIKEEWFQGVFSPSTTTSGRRDHLFKHYFE